jgi:hypothetical protein
VDGNIWLFDYIDDVTAAISDGFGLNMQLKFMELHQIKGNYGITKNDRIAT